MIFNLAERPLRLVLDTHVVLEMLVWHSPRHAPLLALQKTGNCVFLVNSETLDEWRRVLSYSALTLNCEQQAQAKVRYLEICVDDPHLPAPADLPRCRDINDQKFLDLAYVAQAQALLTRDKKLLKIGKNKRYKQRFITLTPEIFLASFSTETTTKR